MVTETNTLINTLQAIVGTAHVLVEGDLSAWERDWRQRQRGRALAVVRPASTDEVSQVVRACSTFLQQHPHSGLAIVPQGGNTGLVLGSTPDDSGRQLVLSLQRMDKVCQIDGVNRTVTVEAGCILQNLQERVRAERLWFPLSLAAEGSCTLGGNLGTNAGGTQVLRFGCARDLCSGLEVVTAQGDVWNGLSGLRKDNTGYDLRHLMIGSEGTLGIITAATLRLFPPPMSQLTAWAVVPSLEGAIALLGLAEQLLAGGLTAFELMGQFALHLVAKHHAALQIPFWKDGPYCVLLEYSDYRGDDHHTLEQMLELALRDGCARNATVAGNLTQARALWEIRERIPQSQALEGPNIKHDISVPLSAIPGFVASTDVLLEHTFKGVRLVNFGHLGDGNLHYNVLAPAGMDASAFMRDHEQAVNTIVFDAVAEFGGSVSAEHGIGSFKTEWLKRYKSPVALAMMYRIKQALDPLNLLNPGRVLCRSEPSETCSLI